MCWEWREREREKRRGRERSKGGLLCYSMDIDDDAGRVGYCQVSQPGRAIEVIVHRLRKEASER